MIEFAAPTLARLLIGASAMLGEKQDNRRTKRYSPRMPHLTIVPKREPTPKERIIERIKAMPRPDGVLQCAKCGCRTVLTTVQEASIVKGKYKRGTVVDDRVCAECWRRGIYSPMMPPRLTVK